MKSERQQPEFVSSENAPDSYIPNQKQKMEQREISKNGEPPRAHATNNINIRSDNMQAVDSNIIRGDVPSRPQNKPGFPIGGLELQRESYGRD